MKGERQATQITLVTTCNKFPCLAKKENQTTPIQKIARAIGRTARRQVGQPSRLASSQPAMQPICLSNTAESALNRPTPQPLE